MFSGIVEEVGTVSSIVSRGTGVVLGIASGLPLEEIRVGDSLSVSGVCLSVKAKEKGRFFADASAETLSRTTFRALATGTRVNLERSLSLSGRLDGPLVYGPVAGTGAVPRVRRGGASRGFPLRAGHSIT